MSNQTYGELFCQAIDTIVKERLKGISYDSTYLCSIVDDSKNKDGIYIVSNGSAKFEALSLNSDYRKGDNVYVQVPGGDWNQQKNIIAKKTNTKNEPFTYKRPFDSFVDLTGNLIKNNYSVSLLANYPEEQSLTVWNYFADENSLLKDYTRLGIQADFQSWLNPFYLLSEDQNEASIARDVVEGDYGLRLRIHTILDTTSKDEVGKEAYYDLEFNYKNMNGNPYNFQSYFQQEKVFDLSPVKGRIIQMELQFYQKAGTFKDIEGNQCPYKDFLGNLITPNLYVNDIYIGLGFDINEFDDETIIINTANSLTYSATADPLTSNHKHIVLQWIHREEDGSFKLIGPSDDLDYELRWYRYELGHPSADEYSDVYWKFLSSQKNGEELIIHDEEWLIYNETCEKGFERYPSFFKTWSLPDITLQEEQIKAILLYNGKVVRSKTLIFTNENEVVSKPTVDAVQALSVNCEDNTYGNYRIYKAGNKLINSANANVEREWKPFFKSSVKNADAIPTELIEAESIEWIIPTKNTMIVIDEDYKKNAIVNIDENGNLHIIREGQGPKGNDLIGINTQFYKIKGYYSQNYSNNTIQCKVIKDKITYTAIKELTFGVAGTTGTDCTFILDFEDNNKNAITIGTGESINVVAKLYNEENKEEILDFNKYQIEWKWKTSGEFNFVEIQKQNNNIATLRNIPETAININNFYILQATLKGWGDYDLVAYLPIPIRSSINYSYIQGPTEIIYQSSGELLDKSFASFGLYNKNGEYVEADWSTGEKISDTENYPAIKDKKEKAFSPTIKYYNGEYKLNPLNIYVKDANSFVAVAARVNNEIVWVQPILIMQNYYPSAMLNEWNGELKIDETNNAVLAAQIAAGRKNANDNTFSGVILGDWQSENSEESITKQTGLYGFHHGAQSFAFKEDGTAFIGKDGKGRIIFNGNKSVITSNAFASGNGGLELDFDNGKITLKNPNNSTKSGTITIDAAARTTPFTIGSKFEIDWDGSMAATDGDFEGTITAESGSIGGWEIGETTLESKNGDLILDSKDESITGGILRTPEGGMWLDGYLTLANQTNSYLGYMESNTGSEIEGQGIGFKYEKGKVLSQIKATSSNVGMSGENGSNGGYITISTSGVIRINTTNGIYFGMDAEDQHGIYARFA